LTFAGAQSPYSALSLHPKRLLLLLTKLIVRCLLLRCEVRTDGCVGLPNELAKRAEHLALFSSTERFLGFALLTHL
jgi:hypothetical protein